MLHRSQIGPPDADRAARESHLRSWLLVVVPTMVLGFLIYSISTGTEVVSLDRRVTALVVGHRTLMLNAMATAMTMLGNEVVLFLLTVIVLASLWLRGAGLDAGFVAVAMAGSATLTVVGKHLLMRARPPVGDVVGEVLDRTYSFPSGHTLNSAVFVVALLWLLLPSVTDRVAEVFLLVVGCVMALGVGLSRVYLGYHWPSDVLGAWLIATVWMTCMCLAHQRLAHRSQAGEARPLAPATAPRLARDVPRTHEAILPRTQRPHSQR
jgi:membrane-associated phospholipid phosphatase